MTCDFHDAVVSSLNRLIYIVTYHERAVATTKKDNSIDLVVSTFKTKDPKHPLRAMTACCTSRTACKPVTDFSPFQWTDQIFSYFGFESYETNQIGSINSTGWNFDEENIIRGGFSLTEFSSRWINGRKPLTWASPLSDGLVRRTFYNSLGQEKATLDKLGHVERLSTLSQTGRLTSQLERKRPLWPLSVFFLQPHSG